MLRSALQIMKERKLSVHVTSSPLRACHTHTQNVLVNTFQLEAWHELHQGGLHVKKIFQKNGKNDISREKSVERARKGLLIVRNGYLVWERERGVLFIGRGIFVSL